MNWLAFLTNPNLIPMIVAGLQAIHADAKSGASKKQLALESLGLAEITAGQVVSPGNAATAAGAAQIAGDAITIADAVTKKDAATTAGAAIDAAVAAFKMAGKFGFKQ